MLSRYLKIFLPVLALATGLFAACSPGPCKPSPPSVGQITVHPEKLEVDKTATLTVTASGQKGLTLKWKAPGGGELLNSEGQSVTYKAPNTVGTYTVTVTAEDCGGSTNKSINVSVVSVEDENQPQVIDLDPGQFIPNSKDPSRELVADISTGVPGLPPQQGQRGVDLRGYKLELSLQGNPQMLKNAQLFFKDCQYLNSYRIELQVPSRTLVVLRYDPAVDSKVPGADQVDKEGFRHICLVGVRVLERLQGVRVVSARLVKK